MNSKMGSSLTYDHEAGLNFDSILEGEDGEPGVIVGSCPQKPADVDTLANAGVSTVVCLQQDSDMAYFDLDIEPVQARCAELGLTHLRLPINDFDPHHLRLRLPDVISDLVAAHGDSEGAIYFHCTAGMGRAPAAAIAYMHWTRGWELGAAHNRMVTLRACSPKIASVRQATVDVLYGQEATPTTVRLRNNTASSVQVSGLDVGWGQMLDLTKAPGSSVWEITRELPIGRLPYKFVIDGRWTYDADHPTMADGDAINNYVTVVPPDSATAAAVSRLSVSGGKLTDEERKRLIASICGSE